MADYVEIAKQALARYRARQAEAGTSCPPFPHCPKCGSFYLWRKDKTDPWDCESCGERGITDEAARRYQ
jgi:Zn ribbon nucleic-acid-binding protein